MRPAPGGRPDPIPLHTVADVRSGYVPSSVDIKARKRAESSAEAERWERAEPPGHDDVPLLALLPKALRDDGTVDWGRLETIAPMRQAQRYALRIGDVLLPLRTQRLQAIRIDRLPTALLLAVGPWAVMTPHHVDGDYLTWFLNLPHTLATLESRMQGSTLRFLTVATVRALEVPLPGSDTQHRIGRLARLTRHVAQLERELADARIRLADAVAVRALQHSLRPR
jgi:hypothetical protein